ncbi:hypothetical protein BGX34_011208 [Mortierella sp. NVP85]|nr:hypothetical protein BGX34_011208 [Mortierella sp. NVP85]
MTPTNAAFDTSSSPLDSDSPALPTTGSVPIKPQDHKRNTKALLAQESDPIASPTTLPDLDATVESVMESTVSIPSASALPEGKNRISRVQDQTGPSTHVGTTSAHREQHGFDHSKAHMLTQDAEQSQRNSRMNHRGGPTARAPSSSPAIAHGRNGYGTDQPLHAEGLEEDDQDGLDMDMDVDMEMDQDIAHHPSDDKYKRLKRKLKQVLESIPPETVPSLLLNRLCTLEQPDEDSGSDSLSTLSSDSDTSESSLSDDIRPRNPFSNQPAGKANGTRTPRGAPSAGTATAGAQQTKKADAKGAQRQSSGAGAAGASGTQRTASKEGKSHTPASIPSTITNVGSATQKPKRIHQTNKQRPGLAKARKVQALEKDEAGNIKFPVTVGIITIWSIGHVVYDREAFHNDRYIWPVGYKMSRLYNSMIDPSNLTTYTCSVIDDGEAPKFQIDAEDQPGKPIIAGSATGAWTHVVKAANAIRKREHSNSASGPDYFGFSNATIAKMIQDLPDVDKCSSYIMQRFEEPSSSSKASSGEKRKASALRAGSKSGEAEAGDQTAAEEEDGEDGDGDGEDDNDSYTTLGTPGKKKARVSSPAIRVAGFGVDEPSKSEALETLDTSIEHAGLNEDVDEGDETHSEDDPEDWEGRQTSSVLGQDQSPTASGDSKPSGLVDNESEVDVGMDEDVSPSSPSAAESMTTDSGQHHP